MLNLFFPKICNGCKRKLLEQEEVICIDCRHHLPIASFHRNNNETMRNLFYGKFPIKAATALIYFQKKGITQELLHNLKYRGHQEIGTFFGKWMGEELKERAPYNTIDMVIPVPLHKHKLKKRGYNQVDGFANEIAKALAVSFETSVLQKISKTTSQVFKERFSRFGPEAVFAVKNSEKIKNKHLLLVDDIITTGATLENCAIQLLEHENVTLSIATIAIA